MSGFQCRRAKGSRINEATRNRIDIDIAIGIDSRVILINGGMSPHSMQATTKAIIGNRYVFFDISWL